MLISSKRSVDMDRLNWDGTPQTDTPSYDLPYTDEVKAATDHLYERVKDFVTPMEWPQKAPLIHAINQLKAEKNAVILAHNYMTADIFHCVGDLMGDSLALARMAAESDAEIIVQAGVHFMAETAKILAPEKTVYIPDTEAGCSLASSITGADVRRIKAAYPGIPVVTYVNTSAEVKAECDICCTSSNAVQVVESLNSDTVILLPDEYLAGNVAAQTDVKILTWKGSCEVHEQFTAQDVQDLRDAHPGVVIITPSGKPDRSGPGRRFCRFNRRHGRLGPQERCEDRRAPDRVLNERQCRRGSARGEFRAPVQSLPAHEAHHAGEHL
jgi:quinolinate synthase